MGMPSVKITKNGTIRPDGLPSVVWPDEDGDYLDSAEFAALPLASQNRYKKRRRSTFSEVDPFSAKPQTQNSHPGRAPGMPRRKSVLLGREMPARRKSVLESKKVKVEEQLKKARMSQAWRDFYDIPNEKPVRERRQSVLETMTDAEIEAMAARGSRWSENLKSNYIALGLTAEDISHLSPEEQLKKQKEQVAWARRSEAALSRVDKKMRRESRQFQSLAKSSPIAARLGLEVEREFEEQAEQVDNQLQRSRRASSNSLAQKLASRGSGLAAAKGRRMSVFAREGEGGSKSEGEVDFNTGVAKPPQASPVRSKRLSNAWKSFLSDADNHKEKVEKQKSAVMTAFPAAKPAEFRLGSAEHPTYSPRAPVSVPGGPVKGSRMSQSWGAFFESLVAYDSRGVGEDRGGDADTDADAGKHGGAEGAAVVAAVKVEAEFEDNSAALDTELTRARRKSASILAAKLKRRASAALLDGMDDGDSAIVEEEEEEEHDGDDDSYLQAVSRARPGPGATQPTRSGFSSRFPNKSGRSAAAAAAAASKPKQFRTRSVPAKGGTTEAAGASARLRKPQQLGSVRQDADVAAAPFPGGGLKGMKKRAQKGNRVAPLAMPPIRETTKEGGTATLGAPPKPQKMFSFRQSGRSSKAGLKKKERKMEAGSSSLNAVAPTAMPPLRKTSKEV